MPCQVKNCSKTVDYRKFIQKGGRTYLEELCEDHWAERQQKFHGKSTRVDTLKGEREGYTPSKLDTLYNLLGV